MSIFGTLALLILVPGLIASMLLTPEQRAQMAAQDQVAGEESVAPSMAEEFVSRFLKAPSTAKYPPTNEMPVASLGNNIFSVSSYVDSQNAFGAMLRDDWSVRMKYLGGEQGNWHLQAIEIDGRVLYSEPSAATSTQTL